MEKDDLSNLAAAVATRRCTLYAGAGLTLESGGASWSDLIEFLMSKFDYSSPLKDNFQIIGDMCKKFGSETVYEEIRNRLKDVRIDEPIAKLIGLPWFATFTTNYDLGLENSLVENQSLPVRSIVTGEEFALAGLQSELLCVKLMGSLDIPYGQPGSMVLDLGDFVIAREKRSRIFDILANHAANLSFLFVGYSFNDGLFLEILERLIKTIGRPENTYYAVFEKEPDEEKSYLLEQYGVTVIVADLKKFSEELSYQVSLRNPADLTRKRIPIGSDVVAVDSTKLTSFLSLHEPILFENLEEAVSPNTFFKGYTESLKPFGDNWHFHREQMEEVISAVIHRKTDDTLPHIITVEGSLGSGRTFVILAAVYELIIKHRAIAIKIPNYTINPIPSLDDVVEFLEEIERATKNADIDNPERIILWAEFTPEITTISQFRNLASELKKHLVWGKYQIHLIIEDIKPSQSFEGLSESKDIILIDVDADLTIAQKERLAQYLVNITRLHKFAEISEEETNRIINEEEWFLPIMYRTLDPARRSIRKIVQEEFNSLSDLDVQTCISLCSLSTSLDLNMPVTILRKALSNQIGRQLSWPDIFEIAIDKARAFIKEFTDSRTNPLVSIYHSLIAQYIVQLNGKSRMDAYLLNIAMTVDIRSRIEAEFVSNLFIIKGVNWRPGMFMPFSADGLEHALSELKNRQPARPIIHHLARLKANKNIFNEDIVPLLNEALAEPKDSYALDERKENILTTLAKIKWNQKKQDLLPRSREDPDIQEIIDLLIKAREDVVLNLHPYDVHARILRELSQSKDDISKIALLNEALEVLDEALNTGVDFPDECQQLSELQIEVLSDLDPKKAEITAKELLEKDNDGTGYYILARIEHHINSNPTKANLYLDKAIDAENYPPGALALQIEIYLQDNFPNYDYLLKLADLLSSDITFQDNWVSAYHKAIIYTINGMYTDAVKSFKISNRKAPRTLQRKVDVFWMENGHRKVHTGKIDWRFTEREGRIYSHNIDGWQDKIFFNPRIQEKRRMLNTGLFVDFELGFSPRGPQAFDVRPHEPV